MKEYKDFPEIVTLCGSTKFKDGFMTAQKELTLQGKIVISVGFFGHADDAHVSEEDKKRLDELHFRKIDLSDSIYVVNVDGYIGWSTENEIAYANQSGKRVEYLEPL